MRRALVIGAHGLLGSGIVRILAADGCQPSTASISWKDPSKYLTDFQSAMSQLYDEYADGYEIYWCAGLGVVGSGVDAFRYELLKLTALTSAIQRSSTSEQRKNTVLFFSSSAGALYAGCNEHPPYTEAACVAPIAPYGVAKLDSEKFLVQWARKNQVKLSVGRITNLYGPGQDLSKQQGLISVLVRNSLGRTPTSIFVPLDTIRDYIFVDDAAKLIVSFVKVTARSSKTCLTKIIGSGRPYTIGSILSACQHILHRKPLIILGQSPQSNLQAIDLSVKSVVLQRLDRFPKTPIEVGIHRIIDGIRTSLVTRSYEDNRPWITR